MTCSENIRRRRRWNGSKRKRMIQANKDNTNWNTMEEIMTITGFGSRIEQNADDELKLLSKSKWGTLMAENNDTKHNKKNRRNTNISTWNV
ncbi:hypothetical protein BLOT_007969 [Blomia tropicalis]|nr:hypothetical protein BLOT_007969 [Blomia tropicalis]